MLKEHINMRDDPWLGPEEAQAQIPPQAWPLISHRGSLTHHLRQLTANKIQFSLLTHGWASALTADRQTLNLPPTERTWIRHIEWRYQSNLWVYAVTLIPETTLEQIKKKLTDWDKPIGELLFQDPSLNRRHFRFCQLLLQNQFNGLHEQAPLELRSPNTTPLWTRQSLLSFRQYPLLITESFLPAAYGTLSH